MRFTVGHTYEPCGLLVHIIDAPDTPLNRDSATRMAQHYWPMRDVLPGHPMHDMARIVFPEYGVVTPDEDLED